MGLARNLCLKPGQVDRIQDLRGKSSKRKLSPFGVASARVTSARHARGLILPMAGYPRILQSDRDRCTGLNCLACKAPPSDFSRFCVYSHRSPPKLSSFLAVNACEPVRPASHSSTSAVHQFGAHSSCALWGSPASNLLSWCASVRPNGSMPPCERNKFLLRTRLLNTATHTTVVDIYLAHR